MSVHHNNVISVSGCVLERGERDREERKREVVERRDRVEMR